LTALLYSVIYSLSRKLVSQPDPFSDHGAVALYNLPSIGSFVDANGAMIVLAFMLVTMVSILFGLFASFRVAGPVYRMREVLAEMEGGNLHADTICLRSGDELQPLYDDICRLRSQWKLLLLGWRDSCLVEGDGATQLAHLQDELSHFDLGDKRTDVARHE